VQFDVVFKWIPRILHYLCLLGSWTKFTISLCDDIKRFEARYHLLVHYVVGKAFVEECVHRDLKQVALFARLKSDLLCFFVKLGFTL
jgi:hypothetical protein